MKLSLSKVRDLTRQRSLSLTRLLEQSGVSRTAFYSLARRESVLPKTVRELARTLRVSPLEILEAPTEQDGPSTRVDRARRIAALAPSADFRNIWHTLALLELTPVERLERSLLRGRSQHLHG
jgi:transcriptional regulator with XRE-family HTH domain